jgi:hypothetical protein
MKTREITTPVIHLPLSDLSASARNSELNFNIMFTHFLILQFTKTTLREKC